jgi:hypothetical protein
MLRFIDMSSEYADIVILPEILTSKLIARETKRIAANNIPKHRYIFQYYTVIDNKITLDHDKIPVFYEQISSR